MAVSIWPGKRPMSRKSSNKAIPPFSLAKHYVTAQTFRAAKRRCFDKWQHFSGIGWKVSFGYICRLSGTLPASIIRNFVIREVTACYRHCRHCWGGWLLFPFRRGGFFLVLARPALRPYFPDLRAPKLLAFPFLAFPFLTFPLLTFPLLAKLICHDRPICQ